MPDTDNPPYTLAPHKDVAMDQVVAKNEATVVVCCYNFEQTRCMNAPPSAFSIFNRRRKVLYGRHCHGVLCTFDLFLRFRHCPTLHPFIIPTKLI